VDKFITMLQVNGIEKAYFMVANNMFEVPADQNIYFSYRCQSDMQTIVIEPGCENMMLLIGIGQF